MGKVTVRKRGNYWSWRFEGATVDGKRQQPTKSGYRTKKEAEIAGNQAYNEYFNSGLVFEPTELSVADYLDYWFDHDVKVNLAYNTQLGYFSIIENHLKPAFGKYKLKALQPAVIQEFADKLKFNGLSKSTIQGILGVLGSAYDYAIEPCNFVKENPCSVGVSITSVINSIHFSLIQLGSSFANALFSNFAVSVGILPDASNLLTGISFPF